MNIILFLRDLSPDSAFHYARKQGGDLKFIYNRQRCRHEAVIPLDQWRANDFLEARMLLDTNLVVPIFFDVEDSAQCVAEVPTVEPVVLGSAPAAEDSQQPTVEPEEATSLTQEAPPVKRTTKRRRLTEEQKRAAQAAFNEQAAAPPSFIPQ